MTDAGTPAKRPQSGIGVNVSFFAYWAPDFPLIDQFKRGAGWFTQCDSSAAQCRNFASGASAWDTLEQAALELDENGWVKKLPAASDANVKFRTVSTLLFQGNTGAHPAGRYVVLYDGQGTVNYRLAGKKVDAESKPGRDVVQVTNDPVAGGLQIAITSTVVGDHIRNIRVLPPGGVCSTAPSVYVQSATSCAGSTFQSFETLYKTQTWHPAFLTDMRGFRSIRFLDWTKANTTKVSSWTSRPKPLDAFWSSDKGVPIEAILDLAKSAGADPWINLSPYADDTYVREFAKLAKAALAPSAVLYLEHGNEPWNYAPPFGTVGASYETKAREKWPGVSNDGFQLRLNWYAYRSAKVCQIVKQEFADQATRVRCAVNSQSTNPWVSEQILGCPFAKAELGSACAKFVDALAIAPYFGYYIAQPQSKPAIDSWLAEADGGLNKLFTEVTGRDEKGVAVTAPLFSNTSKTPARGALAAAREGMVGTKAVADKFGVSLVAYEAGQHIVPTGGYNDKAMLDLLLRANRDARMGAAYKQSMDDWKAAGGELFVHYFYASQGVGFGLKERQFQDSSPKWDAVKAFRDGTPCWWSGCTVR